MGAGVRGPQSYVIVICKHKTETTPCFGAEPKKKIYRLCTIVRVRCSTLRLGAATPLVLIGPTYWSGLVGNQLYSDDLHLIVGSPSTVALALALKALLHPPPPLDTALSLDYRLYTIGLALSHGKSSILMGRDVTPNTLEPAP